MRNEKEEMMITKDENKLRWREKDVGRKEGG